MSERQFVILGVLLFIIFVLYGVYLHISVNLATEGFLLDKLQKQVHDVTLENMLIEEKLYPDEAYTTIEQKAKKEGFVQGQVYYLR